jgi:ABC-2 type transport system permease protein
MLEISTFIFILFAFEYIASGHLFPLDLLPPALQGVLYCTPFPSMLSTPIGIYMGKIAGAGIWLGLLMQLLWLLLGYRLARFAWARGIRKYAAFGG